MEEENQAKSSTKVKKSIVKTKPVSAQAKKLLEKVKGAIGTSSVVKKPKEKKKKAESTEAEKVDSNDEKKSGKEDDVSEREKLRAEIAKERSSLVESKEKKAIADKKKDLMAASPEGSNEMSDNESNHSSAGNQANVAKEELPMTPTNWSADVVYNRDVTTLLALYERAPRQLGYLRTHLYNSAEEEGHAVGFAINQRRENQEIKKIIEYRSRVVHRSWKVPSNFRMEYVAPNSGRDLSYSVDLSVKSPSALKEVVSNYRCGSRESGGAIKPFTTAQAESLAKSVYDLANATGTVAAHCGLQMQVLANFVNFLWAEKEVMDGSRRITFANNNSYSGCSDVRTYCQGEELIFFYNFCLTANTGRCLLLRVNETSYVEVLDAIVSLCGSQPTYQLRDVGVGEQQPYNANWLGENLSLHVVLTHEQVAPSSYVNLHQRMRGVVSVPEKSVMVKALRIILNALVDPASIHDAFFGLANVLVRAPGLLATAESEERNPPLFGSGGTGLCTSRTDDFNDWSSLYLRQ